MDNNTREVIIEIVKYVSLLFVIVSLATCCVLQKKYYYQRPAAVADNLVEKSNGQN